MCFLTPPAEQWRETFLQGAAEFHAEGRLDSTYAGFLGYTLRSLQVEFSRFIRDLNNLWDPSKLPSGWCPDRVLWLIDGEEYIGQISIRPELGTTYLITYGGHIGYSIRPSKRRRGYGQKILAMALAEARKLGLASVLVTCDSDNTASRKIIERNGGRFESALKMVPKIARAEGRQTESPVQKMRYWIQL